MLLSALKKVDFIRFFRIPVDFFLILSMGSLAEDGFFLLILSKKLDENFSMCLQIKIFIS